jgi:uncharacterized SAM-binding protein YcdF (DUF218 family)
VFRLLLVGVLVGALGASAAVVAPGFLLEGPQAPLERADAIIVISGDESLARYREGVRLYRAGWAPTLIFSGAALDGAESNAQVMRRMAVSEGISPDAILTEPDGEDTYGNALHTRNLMVANDLDSAILVTSPYHLHRAAITFRGTYAGTGIRVIGRAAPDGAWRKTSWWTSPETRALTLLELEKLGYVTLTGRYR